MLIGYARTSTADQTAGMDAQRRDLAAAGCERVYAEQVSSVADQRPALAECIDFARAGDVVVASKPDRLARSTADLLRLVDHLTSRDIGLVILSMGGGGERMDTRDPTSRLILTILGGVAEWERQIMLDRQREGIVRAKAEGRYQGRQPTARRKAAEIIARAEAGHTREQIARDLGIGVASVYRVLRDRE